MCLGMVLGLGMVLVQKPVSCGVSSEIHDFASLGGWLGSQCNRRTQLQKGENRPCTIPLSPDLGIKLSVFTWGQE